MILEILFKLQFFQNLGKLKIIAFESPKTIGMRFWFNDALLCAPVSSWSVAGLREEKSQMGALSMN